MALACLLLLATVTGHAPDLAPAEAPGNPPGLAGLSFIGPPGTPIANTVCPHIQDAQRPIYYDGPNHIAHINGITGTTGTPLNYIEPGTVDLWHFEDAQYQNPAAIEGPHDVSNSAYSVMLGSDGFLRGRMHDTISDAPGFDLIITDVHVRRAYCIYGSPYHEGPFIYIHATWNDGQGGTQTNVDLANRYTPLFNALYPGVPSHMNYVMVVASGYVDQPPVYTVDVQATCQNLHPDNLTLAPGVAFQATGMGSNGVAPSTYSWSFGDGTGATGQSALHQYADDGDWVATVTAFLPTGQSGSASVTCRTVNRPPTAVIDCMGPIVGDTESQFNAARSSDPDGYVAHYEWDFGDGATATGVFATHQYTRTGTYTITLTVHDDDWQSTRPTRGTTSNTTTLQCHSLQPANRPPVLDPLPRPVVPLGRLVTFQVTGWDPDRDFPLTYSAVAMPPGATFNPESQLFSWKPDRTGAFAGVTFRVTDPDGLFDEGDTRILVFDPMSDVDLDGVPDRADNCPMTPNFDQLDSDGDGVGDACQEPEACDCPAPQAKVVRFQVLRDRDGDGMLDAVDNCVHVPNADQSDVDGDGFGDVCDLDWDMQRHSDGVLGRPHWEAASAPAPDGTAAGLALAAVASLVMALLVVGLVLRRSR
jgi:chitodextrinase